MADPIHPPIGVRERLAIEAAKKATKASKRHGALSVQYRKAINSRWLRD